MLSHFYDKGTGGTAEPKRIDEQLWTRWRCDMCSYTLARPQEPENERNTENWKTRRLNYARAFVKDTCEPADVTFSATLG